MPRADSDARELSRVFISHASEDRVLAEAWRELLHAVSGGEEDPWYSSDPRAKRGITPGDWRMQVLAALDRADTVIVLLTPTSKRRTWPTWETGVAHGGEKRVIPVFLFMQEENVHDLFRNQYQCYNGLDEEAVLSLCEEIVFPERRVTEETRRLWNLAFERYRERLLEGQKAAFTRALFVDTFHNRDTAKRLEGIWEADWFQEVEGGERSWLSDALQLWTTDRRVRLVGRSLRDPSWGQIHREDPSARTYPMEGVVSSDGWIALSYWSSDRSPVCGTVLLRRRGTLWTRLVGTWEGYSARRSEEDPDYVRGRVEMVRAADDWADWEARRAADGD